MDDSGELFIAHIILSLTSTFPVIYQNIRRTPCVECHNASAQYESRHKTLTNTFVHFRKGQEKDWLDVSFAASNLTWIVEICTHQTYRSRRKTRTKRFISMSLPMSFSHLSPPRTGHVEYLAGQRTLLGGDRAKTNHVLRSWRM